MQNQLQKDLIEYKDNSFMNRGRVIPYIGMMPFFTNCLKKGMKIK